MDAILHGLREINTFPDRGLKSRTHESYFRTIAGFCLFMGAFYFAYRYGMSFSQACASPLWFPNSVLLCALLLSPPRRWWLFILAPLPIRLFSAVAADVPQWFLLATFAIDSTTGLLAAAGLCRFSKNPLGLQTVRDFVVYFFF